MTSLANDDEKQEDKHVADELERLAADVINFDLDDDSSSLRTTYTNTACFKSDENLTSFLATLFNSITMHSFYARTMERTQ